ncbi:DUF45 domain-containing protein [Leptospira gomenensis]|uniref:DUF45 domain-containing protein n=1 Tax=Leptospira gomenensis TaxID=2484974 RepID=A0A5F1YSF9_9LEPT|nr:YgjP-like metallopeptidase domain-containing protein [Leptospira gomenensis]TGK35109.1 DUF45 domain-containing protein [Leptospira gomenensis]TGK35214.1 DUF45 domain-containing protein [Leptospira gomenensis]TGK41075.1 DUF45 domain-containing protein [Leptospira gomenensis]TGK61305.1 DUF45 domain-containing protein [Leptospira gomenensis]
MSLGFETTFVSITETEAEKLLRNIISEFETGTKRIFLRDKGIRIKFFPYSNFGSTVRVSRTYIEFKIHSQYLKSEEYLRTVVDVLLYKLCGISVPESLNARIQEIYGEFSKTDSPLKKRNKQIERSESKNGRLREILDKLNTIHLSLNLSGTKIHWGKRKSKTRLGHYDPSQDMIVINPILANEFVPDYVLEYIVFHELLHVRFPPRRKNGKNVIHGREFRAFEKKFPDYRRANLWLKNSFHRFEDRG